MSGFLKTVDMLSQKPELYINNSIRFKTNSGGIISLITCCLILAAAVNFTVELLAQKTNTIEYNQSRDTNQQFNMTGYPFMVMVQGSNFKPIIDEEIIYSMYASLAVSNISESTGIPSAVITSIKIPLERCDLNVHFGNYRQIFASVPFLEHYFCPSQGVSSIYLSGVFGSISSNGTYLNIWMTRCDNSTRVGKIRQCYDSDTINQKLETVYLAYNYLDNSVNHQNIQTPFDAYLRTDVLPISSTIYKTNSYFYKNVNYTSDAGLIFSAPNLTQFYQVSSPSETVDLRQEGSIPGSFSQLTISTDSTYDSYFRNYEKAQQTLANVGGITKGLMVIAACINYVLTSQLYFMELIKGIFSEFYSVDLNENKPRKSKLFSSRTFIFSDKELTSIKSKNWKTTGNKNTIEKNKESFNNIILKKENNYMAKVKPVNQIPKLREIRKSNAHQIKMAVTLSFIERICPLICFTRKTRVKKLQHYEIVKKYIIQEICIKNVISKFNELDKLKHVILDEQQLSVFQNIDNPPFHYLERLKEKNIKSIWSDLIKMKHVERKNFPELFNDYKNKENKNEIDTNMIHLVECILSNAQNK